ncbi:MAG: LysM peptidoglycan-binding domain-containing protein [Candidatus Accumulibacter sp.]|jgi:hypothetical protein|nr:LysM peptidoglycan-binding domain-containing protein [Accumulibacter sp.]
MTRTFLAFVLAVFGTLSVASANAADAAPELADKAPNQHVVVPGDTLWDISAKFLREPWRWPEIWRANQDRIKNPHRIYPGDVIVLDRDAQGNPYLRLDPKARSRMNGSSAHDDSKTRPRIHEELLIEAIPPIPPNVIEPFIATPLFIEENTLQSAPRIVATPEERVFLGPGDTAYVEGADPEQKEWQVFRNGKPMRDPEDPQRILGYEAFHLGSAKQVKPGSPAVFEIASAKQEMGYGDRLTPAVRPRLVDYVPHAPDQMVTGRVASVYGGVGSGGRLSIVAINRGSADGLEIGNVLALERSRVVTQRDENDRKEDVVVPAVRFGLIFVFRTFERVSYALAVQADGFIEINDIVRTP